MLPARRALLVLGLALVATGAILLSPAAPAQAGHGSVTGTVTDSASGAPIDGVCITVGPPLRCWTYTNAAGMYAIDFASIGAQDGSAWDLYFLKSPSYAQASRLGVVVNGATTVNMQMTGTGTPQPAPTPTAAPVQPVPSVPPGVPTAAPAPAVAPSPSPLPVEQRIALFWRRVDALGPSDMLAATDIGQWAQNVIDRDPLAGISVADFRASTAAMQAAFDRVRSGPPVSGTSDVEQRIALFWQRVGSLDGSARLSTTDLGQWGLNVTARDGAARITVADFRSSTGSMQAAIDRAGR